MEFANEQFDKSYIANFDLFICTINYEERSTYLFERLSDRLNSDNTLVFATDNYMQFEYARLKLEQISVAGYAPITIKYQDYISAVTNIRKAIERKIEEKDSISVYVDYSSMPRAWYCRLPMLFQELLRCDDRAYFWYAEGCYEGNYQNYPTAGIDAFVLFSGRPALLAKRRVHVLGLGYDFVRTQGIISIIDPEYMVLLESHSVNRMDVFENVVDANKSLMAQAAMTASLELSDFKFMISKLCEISYEYTGVAEVIFVPDGPKPLIMAMSLIPDMIKLPGIACLHVTRNYEQFSPAKVTASGKIIGFSITFES